MRSMTLSLLALSAILAGCTSAISVRPLYDGNDLVVVDPRIEGEWITPDLRDSGTKDAIYCRWTVTPHQQWYGQTVSLRLMGENDSVKEGTQNHYHLTLLSLGERVFFDAQFSYEQMGSRLISVEDMPDGVLAGRLLGQVWVQPDFIRIAFLDSEWVMQNIPEKFWVRGYEWKLDRAILTAPSAELRDILVHQADNPSAFQPEMYFCRPGPPCAARALQDKLARAPRDSETLENAATLYRRQGNYQRAVELTRRSTEYWPKDAMVRERFAEALLMDRNFEAARREFEAAEKLGPPEHGHPLGNIAWSFFLQGEYDKAAKAFGKSTNSRENESIELMLLNYFSLLRLGQISEAEKKLQGQTAAFVGPLADHALLLKFQGRLPWSAKIPSEDSKLVYRDSLFHALRQGSEDDKSKVLDALQELIKTEDKDSLLYLTAQIEYERLSGPPARFHK